MCDFDGNLMWTPPSSPSPKTILTMLNQTDNSLNPMNEIFPEANLSKDHNDQTEQRPGLGEILASTIGSNHLTLQTENVSPFSALFMSQTVPSPVYLTSPGLSPSALLQSPMSSNFSHIIPPDLEVGESSRESNAATLIFNNNLHHQPLNFSLPPEKEICKIPTESHVEPFGSHLVASVGSDTIDEANNDLSLQDGFYNFPSPTASFELLFGHVATSPESEAIEEVNSDLTHQPLNFGQPPQEEICEIPMESNVEPFCAPLVASVESDTIDEANNDLSLQDGFYNIPSPTASFELLFDHVAESEVIDDLIHPSMKVDVPLQEASIESDVVGEVNIISMEEENKRKENEGKNDEEKVENHEVTVIDELNVRSSSKKRKFEGTNMIGATRKTNTQRVIFRMETEDDKPDDNFNWRKYGEKIVTGNPNPRSYYKCTSKGCKMKKHIERGAQDDKLVFTTYNGFHDHPPPTVRRNRKVSRLMNRSDSSMPPSSFLTSPDMRAPSSSLSTQTDMTRLFLTGLSKLPSLQVNHQNE